jgi:hypothetical protein
MLHPQEILVLSKSPHLTGLTDGSIMQQHRKTVCMPLLNGTNDGMRGSAPLSALTPPSHAYTEVLQPPLCQGLKAVAKGEAGQQANKASRVYSVSLSRRVHLYWRIC